MFGKKIASVSLIMAFVSLIALFVCLPAAYAHQEAGIQVKGKIVETDPAPFIDCNRVMAPVREIADALGVDVSWNDEKRAVNIVQGENQITMFIGQSRAIINGKDVQSELAPVIIEGRAVVPVKVLAEGLQIPVTWDADNYIANLGEIALTAGSSIVFPPFEFKEGNEIVGFDIDLIHALEEVLGEEIVVKDSRFNKLIPSLLSGEIDLIISGLTVTEHRKEVIAFTTPYFDWGQIILNTKGSSTDIDLEDLASKKIAVQNESYSAELVRALQKNHPNTELKLYESLEAVWIAVEERQADAAVVEFPMTAYYLTNHEESNLQLAGKVFSAQPMGIAVQKSNQELLEKLNRGLETIIENGTYDRICKKWFGSSR